MQSRGAAPSSSGGGGNALPVAAAPVTSAGLLAPASGRRRVILHVDMDCFYAQVERERFSPQWRGRPIAVVQNGALVVTSNYRVRERGLPKMGQPEPMAHAGRHGTSFAGSAMVRYRAASKAWCGVFSSLSPSRIVVMKKGIDECYLDLTEEAAWRIRNGCTSRLVRQSEEERTRLDELASARFQRAEAAWRADDQRMLSLGIAPRDLESTGSLRAAKIFSASTDPITQLRKQASASATVTPTAGIVASASTQPVAPAPNPKAKHLEGLTEEQVEAHCDSVHPIDFCRTDKRLPPCMLVPADTEVDASARLPGVDRVPWRENYVGHVFLDGTSPDETLPPVAKDHFSAPERASVAAAPTLTSLEALASLHEDVLHPFASFAHEDPQAPSHEHLIAVGSQIAFELRALLFEQLGFTTSGGVAPNCMLAKVASSLHKPNQQSVVRPAVAVAFLRDIRLASISGFGPKSIEQVAEHSLVTVGDVQRLARTPGALDRMFSEKFAAELLDIANAVDDIPVVPHVAPKQLGMSKQQPTNTTAERLVLLQWLCAKLMERMIEDEHEYHRRATVLTFSWCPARFARSSSRRCPMPVYREHRIDGVPVHQDMLEAASKLCATHVPPTERMGLMTVGAGSFVALQQGKSLTGYFGAAVPGSTPQDISAMFALPSAASSSSPSNLAASSRPSPSKQPPPPSKTLQPKLNQLLAPAISPIQGHPLPSMSISTFASASAALSPPVAASSFVSASSLNLDMPSLESPAASMSSFVHEGALREKRARQLAATTVADENDDDLPIVIDDEDEIQAMFGECDDLPLEHPSAASAAAAASSGDFTVCPTCRQSIPSHSYAEHTDFHFAAEFQQRIRQEDRLQREKEQAAHAAARPPAPASTKRKKGASAAPAAGSTLDRFMVPSSSSAASPQQRRASPAKPRPSTTKRTPAAAAASSPSLTSFFKAR